jgi:hypothetical protein
MPVRVPQASLARQLRAESSRTPDAATRESAEPSERSPEATRSLMNSLQQGWQRGRLDDLDEPGSAPGDGTDR